MMHYLALRTSVMHDCIVVFFLFFFFFFFFFFFWHFVGIPTILIPFIGTKNHFSFL